MVIARRRVIVTLLLSITTCTACNSNNVSKTNNFTEIVFPDVEEIINIEDFDTYPLIESCDNMTTIATVSNFDLGGNILDSEGNFYGGYTSEEDSTVRNLGRINLVSGDSAIIQKSEAGDYSSINPYLLIDNYLIYRDHDSAPYYYRLFCLNLETNEKQLIEEAEGIGGAMYFAYDGEGVMYSREDATLMSESSVFYWDFTDSEPVCILEDGQGPFLMGDTWYCKTYPIDDTYVDLDHGKTGITLARFDKNGHMTKIKMNNIYGSLIDAQKLDETHILLTCHYSTSSESNCRLFSLDVESGEVVYMFDFNDYMECIEIHGKFLLWTGGRSEKYGPLQDNLLNMETNTLYLPDYVSIVVSDEGIAFNSYPEEEEALYPEGTSLYPVPSYEYWHYARLEDLN